MTSPVRAVFAAAVLRERRARGWTQEVLARKAEVSPACVSNIERQRAGTSLEVALLIAGAFGMTVDALAGGGAGRG